MCMSGRELMIPDSKFKLSKTEASPPSKQQAQNKKSEFVKGIHLSLRMRLFQKLGDQLP